MLLLTVYLTNNQPKLLNTNSKRTFKKWDKQVFPVYFLCFFVDDRAEAKMRKTPPKRYAGKNGGDVTVFFLFTLRVRSVESALVNQL